MNSNIKTVIFWVVLICVAVLLFAVVRTGQTPERTAHHLHRVPGQGEKARSPR